MHTSHLAPKLMDYIFYCPEPNLTHTKCTLDRLCHDALRLHLPHTPCVWPLHARAHVIIHASAWRCARPPLLAWGKLHCCPLGACNIRLLVLRAHLPQWVHALALSCTPLLHRVHMQTFKNMVAWPCRALYHASLLLACSAATWMLWHVGNVSWLTSSHSMNVLHTH